MKRVIIVPVSEISRFSGMSVIARSGTIAALVGESYRERSRQAYDSEEAFLDAVSSGRADLNTFETVAQSAVFAEEKIDSLNRLAAQVEMRIGLDDGLRDGGDSE